MPRPISDDVPAPNNPATKHVDICKRFRACRVKNQLSQGEFASMLGIGVSNVKQIEYGKMAPTIDVLRKLHKRFRLSYDYLIDGKKS